MKSGNIAIAVHAAGADLAHQVHAHRVAAQREERGMTERQDAREAPDQIDGQRQHREAKVFAGQRDHVGRHMDRRRGRRHLVQQRQHQRRTQ